VGTCPKCSGTPLNGDERGDGRGGVPSNICQGGRVTVPLAYREKLSLKHGTRVRIKIRKDEA